MSKGRDSFFLQTRPTLVEMFKLKANKGGVDCLISVLLIPIPGLSIRFGKLSLTNI